MLASVLSASSPRCWQNCEAAFACSWPFRSQAEHLLSDCRLNCCIVVCTQDWNTSDSLTNTVQYCLAVPATCETSASATLSLNQATSSSCFEESLFPEELTEQPTRNSDSSCRPLIRNIRNPSSCRGSLNPASFRRPALFRHRASSQRHASFLPCCRHNHNLRRSRNRNRNPSSVNP